MRYFKKEAHESTAIAAHVPTGSVIDAHRIGPRAAALLEAAPGIKTASLQEMRRSNDKPKERKNEID